MKKLLVVAVLTLLCTACVTLDPTKRTQEAKVQFNDDSLIQWFDNTLYPSITESHKKITDLHILNYAKYIDAHHLAFRILYREELHPDKTYDDSIYQNFKSQYIKLCDSKNITYIEYKPRLTANFYKLFVNNLPDTIWINSVRAFMPERMIISFKNNTPYSSMLYYTRTSVGFGAYDLYSHSYGVVLNSKDTNKILDSIGNSLLAETKIQY